MHHSAFNLSTGYDGMGPPLRLARSALSLPEVKRLERTQFFARDSWRFDFSGADQGFFYYFFFLRNRYGGRPAARAKLAVFLAHRVRTSHGRCLTTVAASQHIGSTR